MVVVVTVLGALVLLLLALAGVTTARWLAARNVEDPDLVGEDCAQDRSSLLPEGHRPPPGLSPLSPSERFLAAEASRGLAALQRYLADAA